MFEFVVVFAVGAGVGLAVGAGLWGYELRQLHNRMGKPGYITWDKKKGLQFVECSKEKYDYVYGGKK